jgi:hypothetical protein
VNYELDTALDLAPRITQRYFASSTHRRKQKDKSRWIIDIYEEVNCFVVSQVNEWVEETTSWGLIQNGNALLVLGENGHDEPLKIAKFIAKSSDGVWHGYPADFHRKIQDRPGMAILQAWRNEGHIEKHHILKIRQGKECNL